MKSLFQTAFEKMTNEELAFLYQFVTDATKGAAGRLSVIEGQIKIERRFRGTAKNDEPEVSQDEFLAGIVRSIRKDQSAKVAVVEGEKASLRKLDDPVFMATVRASVGKNYFFGDEAMRAAQSLDEGFFKSALEAIRTMKRKTQGHRQGAENPKMLLHVEAALRILTSRKGLPQEKIAKQDLEKLLVEKLGSDAFSDRDSWQDLWKRPEIAPYVNRKGGGGRPKKSGKGRAVDLYDAPETPGG